MLAFNIYFMEAVMENSTLSQTSNQRFLPRDYSVNAPIGEFEARLDLMMFPSEVGCRCFFTHLGTGEKFSLIAYRRGRCTPNQPESNIDFASDSIPAQNVFKIVTVRNERWRPVWKSAELISEQPVNSEA